MLPIREFANHSAIPAKAEESLAVAFASFNEAAGSLEKSYAQLQREVMRLRAQLEQTNRELERERETARRAQALAEVATVLAHEIRNPLASLELFAGLLAESPELGEDNQRVVGHVQAGLRTLAATVNNVLQFHSKPPQNLVPTNLANLVRITLEFLSPLAMQSGVELEFDDNLGDVCVGADPHSLQQVLLNLAMNAIRFMPDGGTLKVSGLITDTVNGRHAELRISDTGPGIAAESRAHIFDPGFTTRPGSPGLGLPVCKKIMEQHGGKIELSEAAQGATFVLKFTAVESRA
jgi:two-component system, sensor histidine kinase FlrB